ncbi:MAG: hypothetical protein KDD45_06335, partial [Bdellovibrionales bacterium]|nr:hypothetical protein [Bdellovibrionales bacterium]
MKNLGILKALVISTLVVVFSHTSFAQTTPLKEWTFLVYLNADNNLYPFAGLNIAQMEKVGSSAGVNVVVQLDPEPRNMPTTRYFITQNPNAVQGKITSKVLENLPETDMGNPQTLADFLTWGVKNFPAKKYAVVVWNHGNGWQGVSYDDNPRTNLTMPTLRQGLEAMNLAIAQQRGVSRASARQLIDVLNFDACLMSTLEVAYEVKDTAKYLVGSQFLEPGDGENYTAFLQPLTAKPQMDGREFSEIMVYQYALNYKNQSSINYAAIDLSRVAGFTAQFDQASKVLSASSQKSKIRRAFGSSSFDLVTGLDSARKAGSADA